MTTILSFFKKFALAGFFLLGMFPLIAQYTITVPFPDGFIGTSGGNNVADLIQNFRPTLGFDVVYFSQNSSDPNLFTAQGNDIPGTAVFVSSATGQTHSVDGFIQWRVTSPGNVLEIIAFSPDPSTPDFNLINIGATNYTVGAASSIGFRVIGSTYPMVDDTTISGNAANDVLDSLNAYLAEVQLNAPAGPVTADDLTTTSTTPTIGGTVTLAAGETFSVIVDGQTYDTSNGVTIVGNNWTLTLPQTPLGTYTVTAVITNPSFYTLTDTATLIIEACTVPEISMNTSAGTSSVTNDGTATVVDSSLTIVQPQAITGLTVSVENFQTNDVLATTGTLPGGVTSSFNSTTGVLTITGAMSEAEAQTILRGVTFATTSGVLTDRSISYAFGAVQAFSGNGHYYDFITASGISWTAAKTAAEGLSYYGLPGYLVTVTSQGENDFIANRLQGQGWLGASDDAVEGDWRWVSGPEAGTLFWQGNGAGSAIGGNYNNWAPGEPNNLGGENYATFLTSAQWNDGQLASGSIQGYVVEYGGIGNESCYVLSATKTVTVSACTDPDVPTITGDVVGICEGSTTTLTINGNLNDATQWAIYTGSCGGTLIGTTTTGTFDVGPVADTTYYIRGEGGCVTPGACATVTVTLDATTPISISNSVCEDEGLQWVTWDSVNSGQADGLLYGTVNTTMTHSANGLSTTPAMFNHPEFPAQYNVPNGTTLRNDLAGTFTVTLSEPITDLQVAFSSIGNPSTPVPISFSQPFEVIWANAAVNLTSTTSLTGSEGFCILKFPGTFSTLSWDYLASETYMNLAFGANSFNCNDLNLCQGDSVTLTASGGTGSYEWSPSVGLSGTNTASVVATPTVTTTYTVVDPTNPCVDPRTIVVTVDDTAPTAVGQDITIELDASGNASIVAADVDNGSFDGCAVSTLSLDVTTFDCTNLGSNTVNLTATDSNGNTDSVAVTVTIEDNIAPTAVCQDITIALDATGNATITGADLDNGSTDNCGVSSFTASTTSFTSADIGTNSVTLTVTDSSGNTAVCTATVTVQDNIPPTAVCQNFTVALDATGNASILTSDIDNGSTDNVGVTSLSLDVASFSCADLGNNTVTLTVGDAAGNESTCTATVTVVDNINPTVVTQNITVELDATGNVTIAPADVDNGTADNCSVTSLTLDITSFDCSDVGNNTVTLTAVDQSSNTASATATVTVQDNIDPTVVTQDITVNLDGMGMATIVPADIDNGSTDNCTIDTYSLDIDTFDCDDVGPNTVTLTVVDVNGNSAQASAVVTVVDVTPPVIVCVPDVVTIMDPGVCYAEVFFADAIALDECGIASVVQTGGPVSGSLFTQGVTTIEYTATDVNGNTTVCTFTVTIQDTQIPTIASADDIAVSNDLGVCGAFVTVPPPTITDNCSLDPAPVVEGPVTPLLGGFQLLNTPSTVTGLSNSIGGDITSVVTYNGDWSASFEDFDLRGPDGSQVFFRDNQGVDCPGTDFEDTFSISEATWNGWIATYGSDLTFTLLADPSVNPGLCTNNFYQLSFTLGNGAILVNDYNGTADASDEYPVGTTTVTWTFTDVGGNVVTDTQDITVTDDEAPEMICIGEPGTFNIFEDFEATALPNGWTNIALRGSDLWTFGSGDMSGAIGDFPTNAAIFDDDAAGPGVDNAVQLISPAYNMTGAVTATLSFDYAYNFLSGAEFFSAEIFDGTEWIEILFLQEDVNPTNTGAIDVSAYVNDAFQVRFTYDDGGSGWKWSAGIDNFQLDYDIPSTPLTIALDANGEVTLDVSQLLLSATDNCGPVSTSIGGGAVPGSLSTIFDGGNGGADGGAVYFDVAATADLTLESLQMHIQDPGTFTVSVYAIEGDTYVGNETNAGAWTLVSTGSGESNTTGTPSDVILDTALNLTSGTTYAMALVLDATHSHRYTNGDGSNQNFSDSNISISLGAASNAPFTGTVFSPRVFNGTLNYFVGSPPSTTIDFDCSNLGDNLIEVTATDSSGNVSTCISTVEVIDVTDPILVCQDATVSLDENGMAEVLPEYFIDTDASFDACGITITAVDITDVTCADVGVPITVTVFVSDESGNIASCQATMTVVDDMGPVLVDCPEDMTVDPGALDLFYELPDYTVDVTATDNCTDPVGVITQDPPAGTLLPDGVYTITLSATDGEGNVGSCSFELTVESVLGINNNQLSAGIQIYPNPARKVMNIGNSTNIQLQRALIYDLNGRLIQTIDLGEMDREASVNVAHLSSGVYLVQLEADGAKAIKRLIKE